MSFEAVYRSKQGVVELTKVADFIGSLVIKNEYEARKAETSESLYEYIKYHGAYTGTDSFGDYMLEERTKYKNLVFTYMNSKAKNYDFSMATLVEITKYRIETLEELYNKNVPMIKDYLNGLRVARIYLYDEKNLYYRQFLGKPNPSDKPIYIINKDNGLDGYTKVTDLSEPPVENLEYFKKDELSIENEFISLGYLESWTTIDEDTGLEKPIADEFYILSYMPVQNISKSNYPLTYNYYILQNNIEKIINEYPDSYYLRFIGTENTSFYLRSLENYSIIKYNETILTSTELYYFFKAYDKAKKQVLMDYIDGFDSKQPLYNLLMIQNLLYYTVINYSSSYIERYSVGIYTREDCDNILDSYGYSSLKAISDLTTKQRIVRNINELISNKGNNYVLEIIMSKILSDQNSELKRYYLEKKYTTDEESSIEIDTTKGLENSVSLVFREVPALSINELSTTVESYHDYDTFVEYDDMWGGINEDDSLDTKKRKKDIIKNKLIASNFSSILTKYITLTRTVDVQESQRQLRDLIYIMLKNVYDNDSDAFFNIAINFENYTVTPAGLFAALCWTQQMKNSKNLVTDTGLPAERVVQNRRFEDSDVICKDECVITSSVVFRKMGLLGVDVNTLENNVIIINGKPVKVMDISPEIASWKVVDFIKENPELFQDLLEDIDLDGKYIPTARFTNKNGEKGVLTLDIAPADGVKHLVDYEEQIEDFLTHFRYYDHGKQLGEVNKNTTFAELVMDYKNQFPRLIQQITKKLQESYDFREFQAWQYMLQQSRTNNSINFIFKGYSKFSDYIDHMKSSGLIDYINKNIPVTNGKYRLSDVIFVQNMINEAFRTWVTDSFSTLIYHGDSGESGRTPNPDMSFVDDMKLLFDEFLSVFSQLYSINYKYQFGGSEDSSGMYLQLFYNPIYSRMTDDFQDKLGLCSGVKTLCKFTDEDNLELTYRYDSKNFDNFVDNINNSLIDDGSDYKVEDQFNYDMSTHVSDRFNDRVGYTESMAMHSTFNTNETLRLNGMLKIKTSSGEKIYYE
jgi:hypothetical protein